MLGQVLHRAARDPQQEEVEHREEPELQGNGDRVLHRYSSSNPSSTRPSVILSPGRSTSSCTRRPFTFTPFVEPRSTIIHPSIVLRTSACLRDTLGSSTTSSQSRLRPIVMRSPASRLRL